LIFAACVCAVPALADSLTGRASIIDGDALEIHGTRIRLVKTVVKYCGPDFLARTLGRERARNLQARYAQAS
jgi:hypothetical protein